MGRQVRMGIVALLIMGAFFSIVYFSVAQTFASGYEVKGLFPRAGQLLRSGSDVKSRGVLVGQVVTINVTENGTAEVGMRINPDVDFPSNVMAAVRAKTLFGEKYIDIIAPSEPAKERLREGSVIPLSETIAPIEVETILEKAVPLLAAIDPENFSAALDALAQGFVGSEQHAINAIEQGHVFLEETAPTLANFRRNLGHLGAFAAAVEASDDDLIAALEGLEVAADITAKRKNELSETLDALVPTVRSLANIAEDRRGDFKTLSAEGAKVLGLVADRKDVLSPLLQRVDAFLAAWVADLSLGPHWRITVVTDPITATPYEPGQEPRPRGSVSIRDDVVRALGGTPNSAVDLLLAPVSTNDLTSWLASGLKGALK